MKTHRRLAAIMFTDIEGYTRLMRDDEARAVEVRRRHRQIFRSETARYDGEVIAYYGDGTLSIFDSTVQAVHCAAAMQRAFREEPEIPVRIGIHTGDIVQTEDDIIGDSVNLAARVESMAVAGSVLVSGKVADELRSHRDLPLRRLGAFTFKNDGRQREVYALDLPELRLPDPKALRGKLEPERPAWQRPPVRAALVAALLLATASAWLLPRLGGGDTDPSAIRKLAVLPFSDPSRDTAQSHLIEGVHEAIISELHRVGLEVVPRRSMMAYRGSDKGIRDIVRELGVDALVQGTILRQGDSLNIDLLLIQDDGGSGDIVWDRSFPAEVKDLFILYRDVTRAIAGEIELALSPSVQEQLDATAREVDGEALEAYLKGRQFAARSGRQSDIDNAIDQYERALAIDPAFGPAYTGLVEVYLLQGFGAIDPFEAHAQFRIYAQRALELDPAVADAHHLRAMIHIFSELDWASAEQEIQLALAEDPDSPDLLDTYCQYLWAVGRVEESVAAGERAIAAGPDHHFAHCDLAWAYYYNQEPGAARAMIRELYAKFPEMNCGFHIGLDYRLRLMDDLSEQQLSKTLQELDAIVENEPNELNYQYGLRTRILLRLGRTEEARGLVQALEDASRTQFIDPTALAVQYVLLGERDKAFDKLEEAFLQRSFLLMYTLKASPDFEPLRDDPRYEALLQRMNLDGSLKS